MIKTLIVDDEPIARKVLSEELEQFSDIMIVGEAENGREALEQIEELRIQGSRLKVPHPVRVFVRFEDEKAVHAAMDFLAKEGFRCTLRADAADNWTLIGVISQTLCKKIGGGRVAAREVLFNTASIANLIREGKTFQIPSIMQTSKGMGMTTMNAALERLVAMGDIDADEATQRLRNRIGHFMPPSLVPSQFATLEPLDPDEAGLELDANRPPAQLVALAAEAFGGAAIAAGDQTRRIARVAPLS